MISSIIIRRFIQLGITLLLLVAVAYGIGYLNERDERNAAIRNANGGVLPGKEAIDNYGKRYIVRTLTYDSNTYVCFLNGPTMGCAKEEK